jgi:predicted nucleic acid-binding protein
VLQKILDYLEILEHLEHLLLLEIPEHQRKLCESRQIHSKSI